MSGPRAAVPVLAGVVAVLGAAATASAQPVVGTARLQGRFAMTGRITLATHIRGERRGQRVLRTWTFTPLCAAGGCDQVALARQRQTGIDNVVLTLRGTNDYVGEGQFFAPLTCGGRRYARGESVSFTVTVRITAMALLGGVPVATALHATYRNPERVNRTRWWPCPGATPPSTTGRSRASDRRQIAGAQRPY